MHYEEVFRFQKAESPAAGMQKLIVGLAIRLGARRNCWLASEGGATKRDKSARNRLQGGDKCGAVVQKKKPRACVVTLRF